MTVSETHVVPPEARVSRRTTMAYGFGAAAYGVKDSGFGTFLLLYYNQVVGIPASTVGLVIMCALVLDAFFDLGIGVASDRTRSRWGRRHPWMYAAALPIALGWIALWNPPAMSQTWTLVWLFLSAVLVRTAVSAYEVPSQALTPELTADYDERTRITAYRYLFGWAGGLLMLGAAYTLFLTPTPEQPNGLLNADGYVWFGIAGAALMFVAILTSAIGTHHEIERLPKVPLEKSTLAQALRELTESVNNRAFAILMLAGLCAYTCQGISYALSNYLYSYVWRFEGATFAILPISLFLGVIISFLIAPRVAKRIGKPLTARLFIVIGAILMCSPYALRLLGLFPAYDDPMILYVLFAIFTLQTGFLVSTFMLSASMMADVVEHSEEQTGRRSEGVFYSGAFFVQKCTSGVGIFIAGSILAFASFPTGANPAEVPVEVIDRLTTIYIGIYLTVASLGAWLFGRFPFGKDEHHARVQAMAAQTD
ncbi:MFS transporter [Sphingomonas sp. AX6]|uniref:MFS transporter n=1 Tax=Sphingomonas sp. AX6 TaxID=2653171 RepID=UPI0012F15D9B|nr:MFS transporter [Sphingomonas sp. AX6]VXC84043.1 Sodium:melibiose symporter [Sphingomonas sp. AX6]